MSAPASSRSEMKLRRGSWGLNAATVRLEACRDGTEEPARCQYEATDGHAAASQAARARRLRFAVRLGRLDFVAASSRMLGLGVDDAQDGRVILSARQSRVCRPTGTGGVEAVDTSGNSRGGRHDDEARDDGAVDRGGATDAGGGAAVVAAPATGA